MAHHRVARTRTAALALAATLVVGAGLSFAAGPAQAAGPTLTLSTNNVKDGQTVTVKGKGYASTPTNLFIAVCQNPPTATDCDTDLTHVVQVNYDGGGSFTTKYTVHTSFTLHSGATPHTIDCAKVVCVVGSTNAADPKDHTYNATAIFTVKSGAGTKAAASTKTPTTGSDPSTSATGAGSNGLANTGSSPVTPLIGAVGIALTLGGGALVVANSRRRPRTHA